MQAERLSIFHCTFMYRIIIFDIVIILFLIFGMFVCCCVQ